MSYIIIEWIAADLEEARTIASEVISKKLAACINILPSVKKLPIQCHLWSVGRFCVGQALIYIG